MVVTWETQQKIFTGNQTIHPSLQWGIFSGSSVIRNVLVQMSENLLVLKELAWSPLQSRPQKKKKAKFEGLFVLLPARGIKVG